MRAVAAGREPVMGASELRVIAISGSASRFRCQVGDAFTGQG
jgi:hypothetical protein